MKEEEKKQKLTPAEFYKLRRPEYFSDSITEYEFELTQEVLRLELQTITSNQKEYNFESLCRRLSERLIAPNLIPMVGPTGGGDGKTDSDTHPVSQLISDRWFIHESEWDQGEKWAFAFSAKKKWKEKVKKDVETIVGTKRGFTKIFFFTNQLISNRNKKDVQVVLQQQYKLEIVILDQAWIVESVFSNNLIDIVVDSLNMTQAFKNKKVVLGGNDAERLKQLEKLEENIANTDRYLDYDFQLVEDALDVAILSRMLEKPRDEVEGKFERALRFCKKVNFTKQFIRIHYQRAWTYINYYDDYRSFVDEYNLFTEYVKDSTNILEIELLFNLFNLLQEISAIIKLSEYKIELSKEKSFLISLLEKISQNEVNLNSAAIAKTYINILSINDCIALKNNPEQYFKEILHIIENIDGLIDYPIEKVQNIIQDLGDIFYDDTSYDNLIDKIVLVAETRFSQITAGKLFLKRGIQKLEHEKFKDAIVYLGRSITKLSKDECKKEMYVSYVLLGIAYRGIGLIWASNNCLITAANISLKTFHDTGNFSHQAISCITEIVINETLIGRIPNILSWLQIFLILSTHINAKNEENEVHSIELFDLYLSTRLLNSESSELSKLTMLPDLLVQLQLNVSKKCLLYLLGHDDTLAKENLDDGFAKPEELESILTEIANHPVKEELLYSTKMIDGEKHILTSNILGCEFQLILDSEPEMILVSEALLAFFESFLGTSLKGVYPKKENVVINIVKSSDDRQIKFTHDEKIDEYSIEIKDFDVTGENINNYWESLTEITVKILFDNFIVKQPLYHVEQLLKEEELNERLSPIFQHRTFTLNSLGNEPKFRIQDWYDDNDFNEYPLISSNFKKLNLDKIVREQTDVKTQEDFALDLDSIRHSQRKMSSVIDIDLWDKAKWLGIAYDKHQQHGLCISLIFENISAGSQIFDNWTKSLNSNDEEERIRFTIVKGVNAKYPFYYRIVISTNFHTYDGKKSDFVFTACRIHEMTPQDSKNLDFTSEIYQKTQSYMLCPGYVVLGQLNVLYEKGIKKKQLNIVNAWEIEEYSQDACAIRKNDIPFIPEGITNAPVLKIINKK